MLPLGKLINQAIQDLGLSKPEVIKKVGYYNLNNGLKMLDDLISGKALGYKHTPMRRLPEVLNIPQEDFDRALAQWYDLKRIEEENERAERGIYNERTFKPHLWLKTSRTTPEPIFPAAMGGEAMFKLVRLPAGVIGENGEVDFEKVGQIIRDHYQSRQGNARVFGDILSYYLIFSYDDPGDIEFSPDGQIIDTEPQPLPQGEASLSLDKLGNKLIPPEIFNL